MMSVCVKERNPSDWGWGRSGIVGGRTAIGLPARAEGRALWGEGSGP